MYSIQKTIDFYKGEIAKFERRLQEGTHHPGLTRKWLRWTKMGLAYHEKVLLHSNHLRAIDTGRDH